MDNLQQQIDNLKTLQESYDAVAQAAEAYNTGKVQLAENITSKGVQASASETLPELAQKVGIIAQTQTILEGGEVMAAQQFGDGALWNLYQVLADMKTRFMGNGDYAALIVCEYYKGYDSLQLQGADAYYTCDGDLYDYASPNHVWHDADNGKTNRWVAFLYHDEGARLDITNTAISPRSMYIGGHIGTIEYFVNGRLTELVCGVEDTDVVDDFISGGKTQQFGRNCILRGIRNIFNQPSSFIISSDGNVIINGLQDTIITATQNALNISNAEYIEISGCKSLTFIGRCAITTALSYSSKVIGINLRDVEKASDDSSSLNYGAIELNGANTGNPIQYIIADSFKRGKLLCCNSGGTSDLIDIRVGAMETNLYIRGWNPTNVLTDATKKAQLIENIKNHILARVSDATGGTQLVFTISTNMYNEVASETIEWQGETMSLADAFLTKNWLLAGA